MTLTEFLLARIAEDEQTAHGDRCTDCGHTRRDHELGHPYPGCVFRACDCPAHRPARHDPARVLARCDVDRRLVTMHTGYIVHRCELYDDDGRSDPMGGVCNTLRLLALPYADHPDYREEWRP